MDPKTPSSYTGSRLLWSLGLHSSGIIAYQLVLMQLISIMQWYHFAYMIISIAMLGFGASGTVISLFRKKLLENYSWLLPSLIALTGFLMILSFHLARHPSFQFDLYLLFVDRSQFGILVINYILYFLPFFTGALVIGLIFIENAGQIGKFYFSNLLGSGAGGILAVIILSNLFPVITLPLISVIPLVASLLLLNKRKIVLQITTIFITLFTALWFLISPGQVPVSEYKSLSKTLNLPEAKIIFSKPDARGLIEVVESPALRYAPALSLTFTGSVPVKKNVFINGNFYGAIPIYARGKKNIHDFTTEALPFIMQSRDKVLVINAATGNSIAHALQNESKQITAILEIKGVKEIMKGEFAGESGYLFHNDSVNVLYQDSRQYLASSKTDPYDLIILPRLESFGGSTGLQALDEDYTLTLEAFGKMWDKLSPEGVISITTWVDYPPRTVLKIAATLGETLRRNNIENPSEHIAAIRSWGTITFALKKSAITKEETSRIREFSSKMLFDPLFLPNIEDDEREQFNMLENRSLIQYLDKIILEARTTFPDEYDFYIHPATDDKPYFQRFLKISSIKNITREFGMDNLPFLELGYIIVWITLIQSSVLAFVFIILPLFRLKGKSLGKPATLLYFGALGLGYMFVEIILIQRFILYFGHPVYAISAVISTMMIASGAGSLLSGKFSDPARISGLSAIAIGFILFIYGLFLTPILTFTIENHFIIKFIIALILIAVPSFFMGMPFPSGIRILHNSDSKQIPWAWGINGCLSVIATSLATLVAVESGFRLVIWSAMGLYLVASFIFWKWKVFTR
jgi:predicted membrane-bound spermidine synthase